MRCLACDGTGKERNGNYCKECRGTGDWKLSKQVKEQIIKQLISDGVTIGVEPERDK